MNAVLEDSQMSALKAGAERSDAWFEVERPSWPFDVPAWCGGAHVDMKLGWASNPWVRFKQIAEMPAMGVWHREVVPGRDGGTRWSRTSPDGHLMEQLWHGGALSARADGSLETTQQDGFGGRTSTIEVLGLGNVHLRGPWFGGTADGFNELTAVDLTPGSLNDKRRQHPYWRRRAKAWHQMTGCFGLYISDDLLVRLLSRFVPHLHLARIQPYRGASMRIEPYVAAWGCPKRLRADKEQGE